MSSSNAPAETREADKTVETISFKLNIMVKQMVQQADLYLTERLKIDFYSPLP
jgi:hypothetical protein